MDLNEIQTKLAEADKLRADLNELLGNQLSVTGTLETVPKSQHDLIGRRVIARTYTSGVSIGTLESFTAYDGTCTAHLTNATRLWKWEGAFTLSEVATKGPKTARVATHPTEGVWMSDRGIELLPMSDEAFEQLRKVAVEGAS